jgi:hypothetical protein
LQRVRIQAVIEVVVSFPVKKTFQN